MARQVQAQTNAVIAHWYWEEHFRLADFIVSNRTDLDNFWFPNHPGNNQVVSGTEFPSARQHAIVLSAIPSQVLPTGLHISGVPIASVPVFVAYQVSEMSRSCNLMLRVSRIPPHLCLTPSSPLEACLVIENSERFGPKAHLQTQLHLPDVVF